MLFIEESSFLDDRMPLSSIWNFSPRPVDSCIGLLRLHLLVNVVDDEGVQKTQKKYGVYIGSGMAPILAEGFLYVLNCKVPD